MNAELLKNLIIVITIAIALLKVVLNELDVMASRKALVGKPAAEITKAVEYTATKRRFETTTTIIQASVVVVFLVLGLFGQIQQYVAGVIAGQIWQDLVFLLVMALGLFVLGIPASIYRTFVIEAKYGFNRTTVTTFILDRVRGIILGAVILGPILLGLLWVYQLVPNQIWWIAFLAINLVGLLTAAIGTTVILPLFNKLQELPEGELREKIFALCEKQNYKLKRIYVMDGSKRSSKTNAFFSGIGKTKTIVLFDSLIAKHTVDEVVGVLGHEMGHDKLGHVRSGLILNLVQSFLIFALFGWALQEPALTGALGGSGIQLVLSLIAFGMLFSPISFLLSIFDNSVSRKNEHGADIFASKVYGKEHIISALQRLGTENLANPSPHPFYVLAYYSHPPVSKRVSHVEQAKLA
ncbi:MAG: M48 family peptidase [Micrococcales bacterium]|nr:M48 family peptidase [Micrococcales bacterium]